MKSKQWAIYRKETNTLIEGGFFSRDAADAACKEWNDYAQPGHSYEVRVQK